MALKDLANVPLNDGVDVDNLPDQLGSSAPPPQPGTYLFQLPRITDAHVEPVDGKDFGPRVKINLREDPLTILQGPGGAHVGETFGVTLTNIPLRRGKGDNAPLASDLDYVNRALGITLPTPRTNLAYATALIEATKAGDAAFLAEVEWSWVCNPKKHAWFDDGQGGTQESEQDGCGAKYYQSNVAKIGVVDDNGQPVGSQYPLRITCGKCGASLRAFGNLRNFKPRPGA